ncbi:FHA domain-containing protein, partial [bacterium]|nr:FHA domain-containing protein [bacterium]
ISSYDTIHPDLSEAPDVSAAEAPGRIELADLARSTRGLSRAEFLARFHAPFLLQLNEGAGLPSTRETAHGGRFQTVAIASAIAHATKAEALPPLQGYEVRKRPGANAFALMVTIGRAMNNDIVVPHQSVSKFHASLARGPGGEWAITDSSSNGTWVDGDRLVAKQPRVLHPPSCVSLARSIVLVLLSPETLWDELERMRRIVSARGG